MQCESCSATNPDDARFCAACGTPLVSHHARLHPAILADDFDVAAVSRLRSERDDLSRRMSALLEAASGRRLTTAEDGEWRALHDRWLRVSQELTARTGYLEARREEDRRRRDRREAQRRKQHPAIPIEERRSGTDRRVAERRSGSDRRPPFPEFLHREPESGSDDG